MCLLQIYKVEVIKYLDSSTKMRGNSLIALILTLQISYSLTFLYPAGTSRNNPLRNPSLSGIHFSLDQINTIDRNNDYWRLTTLADENSSDPGIVSKRDRYIRQPITKAVNKFKARPGTYLLIPCIAALVGW